MPSIPLKKYKKKHGKSYNPPRSQDTRPPGKDERPPPQGKKDMPKKCKGIELYLPSDTKGLVKSHFLTESEWKFDNPGLFYQKILPPKTKEKDNKKLECLERFKDAVKNGEHKEALKAYYNRIEMITEKYKSRGYVCNEFTAKTSSRMVVGLGGASVLETNMTFHRYGFPYIPASAVKGILASYLKEEGWKEDEERYREIFGSQNEKGKVIFLDALPVEYPTLDLDIMNPHFGKYYDDGKTPPADYLTPVPIPFLTVAQGSEFKFIFLSKKNVLSKSGGPQAMEGFLKKAIERGVGAKTAVGYGEMEA